MRSIKFSAEYHKMPMDYNPSKLIQIIPINNCELDQPFIEYDTKKINNTYYPLSFSNGIILLLLTEDGYLWTTIRRHTPSKWNYYKSMVGEWFEIRISGDKTQKSPNCGASMGE